MVTTEPAVWSDFQNAHEDTRNVRKSLATIIALAPADAPVVNEILSEDGRSILPLPEAYWPVGLLTTDGVAQERDSDTEEIEAHGHLVPVREDITSDSRTVSFTAYEIHRRNLIAVAEGVPVEDLPQLESGSHEVSYELPASVNKQYYRALIIDFDGTSAEPYIDAWFYPRISQTDFPSMNLSRDDAKSYELSFKAFVDNEQGYIAKKFHAGLGFSNRAASTGWQIESGESDSGE